MWFVSLCVMATNWPSRRSWASVLMETRTVMAQLRLAILHDRELMLIGINHLRRPPRCYFRGFLPPLRYYDFPGCLHSCPGLHSSHE